MVLLIDTNVLIDNIMARSEFYESADKIFDFCSMDENEGYVAFHSLPNIWYVLRKKDDTERRRMLKDICTILTVTGASHESVIEAIDKADFKDFEDCLQDKCAMEVNADYIVTRNVKDFATSSIKAITPVDFCKQFLDNN